MLEARYETQCKGVQINRFCPVKTSFRQNLHRKAAGIFCYSKDWPNPKIKILLRQIGQSS